MILGLRLGLRLGLLRILPLRVPGFKVVGLENQGYGFRVRERVPAETRSVLKEKDVAVLGVVGRGVNEPLKCRVDE